MTITEYFQQPDAQRILLMDIQRTDASATCYRISDAPYRTEASDLPASFAYSPIIGGAGLPELRRTLNEVFDGGASTGFGTVTLIDTAANYSSTTGHGSGVMTLPRGTAITVRVAAPRSLFPLSDAVVLAVGKVNRLGADSDGSITIEIIDRSQELSVMPITADPAVGPKAFGFCRNVTPFLIDGPLLKYAVHDGAIEEIVSVYDDGVVIAFPAGWTKNLAAGTFTLTNSPLGTITADVRGAKVAGTWLQTSAQIVNRVLDIAGVSGITRSITLPAGLIGYYITQTTTLGAVLEDLAHGCAGYWLVDRDGDFIAAQYPMPAAGAVLNESVLIDKASWDESSHLYNPTRYAYRKNWTQYQAKPAATTGQATFAAGAGLTGNLSIVPVAEYTYEQSPVFQTFFDQDADALVVAGRLRDLHSVPRKLIEGTAPYSATLDIGSNATVSFSGYTFNGAVVAVGDVFDGSYPVQRIRVIA